MQEQKSVSQTPARGEVTIDDILSRIQQWGRFLKKKWKLLLLCGLIGAGAGIGYSLVRKPTYAGELTFVLENSGESQLGGYSSIAAQFGLNLGGSGGGVFSQDENMMSFIRSRTMVVKTLLTKVDFGGREELLVNRYIDFNDLRKKWEGKPLANIQFPEDPEQTTVLQDSVLNIIYKSLVRENLVVQKPDKKTDVLSVMTVSTDELFSKAFTENLLENVTEFYIVTQTRKSTENVTILQRQTDSVRKLLNYALTGVAVSADANPNPNPAFQTLRVPSQRKMVDVEMNKAILEELVKHLELAKISLRKETPLIQIVDKPVLPLEKDRVGKLKGSVTGFLTCFILATIYLSIKFLLRSDASMYESSEKRGVLS
jgi:hypothetical protein